MIGHLTQLHSSLALTARTTGTTPSLSDVHTSATHHTHTTNNNMIDFDTNDFEYLQALVVEEYMAEFLEDLADDELDN